MPLSAPSQVHLEEVCFGGPKLNYHTPGLVPPVGTCRARNVSSQNVLFQTGKYPGGGGGDSFQDVSSHYYFVEAVKNQLQLKHENIQILISLYVDMPQSYA